MDRNAKLRATSGTTNIHQQSSPLSYHKYREIHYNLMLQKMEVNRLNPVQKGTYFLKKCTHILTRTQGEKFEDMSLVKVASKGTSLRLMFTSQSIPSVTTPPGKPWANFQKLVKFRPSGPIFWSNSIPWDKFYWLNPQGPGKFSNLHYLPTLHFLL